MVTPSVPAVKTIVGFLSYADADRSVAEELWDRLRGALKVSGEYRWELWAFTDQLIAGDDFDADIKAALAKADLGIFALSNAFLASEYIRTVELPPFLAPGSAKRVVPIALKRLARDADLRGLQARQIFNYRDPYYSGRAPHARDAWANALADELHRVARRYGLGR
ncbi:MAG: hypothetical protein QOE53_2083 [Pseudonocardiales bacterium]|jgi:hypothetical protein|nr:hypothetical protein [Pseudonocardiales bacterium]